MYKITEEDYKYAEVQAIVRYRTCNKTLELDDLIQAAKEALTTSLKTYDMNKGVKFTHYAYRGIYQAMSNIIEDENRESDHCELHDTLVDPRPEERSILNYDLLTQAECDLWDDLNNSKMSIFEYAKYKGIPDSTLYANIQCIRNKIIKATLGQ